MSRLIEAAKRLAKNGFTPWEDSCHLTCEMCGEDGAGEDGPFPHADDCPWLEVPRIVAALEKIKSLATEGEEAAYNGDVKFLSRLPGYILDVLGRDKEAPK